MLFHSKLFKNLKDTTVLGSGDYTFQINGFVLLKDISSEERFHVELHFSPGVKGVEEEENAPTGFGFRPASAEVARQVGLHGSCYCSGDGSFCS